MGFALFIPLKTSIGVHVERNIDALTLLSGKDINVTSKITFVQPSLRDVIANTEKVYYEVLRNLTAIPSDMKSVLFDVGIDWEELSDFELFYMLTRALNKAQSEIFFRGVDFSKFALVKNQYGDILMYDKENDVKIDLYGYKRIQECLCKTHGIVKKPEFAGTKLTKAVLIEEDRQKRRMASNDEFKSQLVDLVSSMVNYAGFKYDYSSVWDMKMYQFMDAVHRSRMFESTSHLLNGVYFGNVDTSKIKDEKFNWMREMHDE